MSNAVFPTLLGLQYPIGKRPYFTNRAQPSVSGREVRFSYQAFPLYELVLSFEFLRADVLNRELQTIAGFFLSRQGSFDSFLFYDASDGAVIDQFFGTGDGSTKSFQLSRAYGYASGTFTEPVQNINALANIKVNGTVQTQGSQVTVDGNGLATFASAPAFAAPLTWTGTFYYRCRFANDFADYSQFMNYLWEYKGCKLIGAPGNRV